MINDWFKSKCRWHFYGNINKIVIKNCIWTEKLFLPIANQKGSSFFSVWIQFFVSVFRLCWHKKAWIWQSQTYSPQYTYKTINHKPRFYRPSFLKWRIHYPHVIFIWLLFIVSKGLLAVMIIDRPIAIKWPFQNRKIVTRIRVRYVYLFLWYFIQIYFIFHSYIFP